MPSYHFYIKKKFNLKYRNAKIYISETHVNNITLTNIYIGMLRVHPKMILNI
jgi:hypothetical protein